MKNRLFTKHPGIMHTYHTPGIYYSVKTQPISIYGSGVGVGRVGELSIKVPIANGGLPKALLALK